MTIPNKNNSVEVWDVVDWKLLNAFGSEIPAMGNKIPISSISWSPNGTKIAVGSRGHVEVYDIATGGNIISMNPAIGGYCIAWSHDATKFIWSNYNAITIWNLTTGSLKTLQGNNRIRVVTLSPDDTKIAVAAWSSNLTENFIEIWDIASGECLKTLVGYAGPGEPYITDVAWNPKNNTLLSSYEGLSKLSGVIQIWDLTTYNCTKTIYGNTYGISSVSWHPDGTKFAYDCGPTVNIWDVSTNACVQTFTGKGHTWTNKVLWSPDGTKLVYGSGENNLIVQNMIKNESIILEGCVLAPSSLSWSPDSTKVVAGAYDDINFKIWDANTGKLIRTLSGHIATQGKVSWSPDGNKIVSAVCLTDWSIRIWGENENVLGADLYYGAPPPIIVGASINKYSCKKSENLEIRGAVVDNTSAPVLNANVTIEILETGAQWTTTTNSSGGYCKTIVAPNVPGNYTIRVEVVWDNYTGYKQMKFAVKEEAVTNGGQQPSDGENKYGINLNYVIAIVGVIVACIIIGIVLVKHKGKQSAKVKEEKKPTQMLRCPKCKKTFRVELKPKPFSVKCPHCGKEGTIK